MNAEKHLAHGSVPPEEQREIRRELNDGDVDSSDPENVIRRRRMTWRKRRSPRRAS